MTKIKLTKLQHDFIKMYQENNETGIYDFIINLPLQKQVTRGYEGKKDEQETMLKLMKAFVTNEYDVIEEINVGDWVKDDLLGIVQVQEVSEEGLWVGEYYKGREFRHKYVGMKKATNEEIKYKKMVKWWNGQGREVWELKLYDCVIDKEGKPFFITSTHRNHNEGTMTYKLSNGETYEKFFMEGLFKVLYLTRDRLDNA